jgi:hypothetical protein
LLLTSSQAAGNHTVSGVRVSSKMVPAVTETRRLQPAQRQRRSGARQPWSLLRRGKRTHRAAQPVEVVEALPVLVDSPTQVRAARKSRDKQGVPQLYENFEALAAKQGS